MIVCYTDRSHVVASRDPRAQGVVRRSSIYHTTTTTILLLLLAVSLLIRAHLWIHIVAALQRRPCIPCCDTMGEFAIAKQDTNARVYGQWRQLGHHQSTRTSATSGCSSRMCTPSNGGSKPMELERIFWNPILSTKLGPRTNGVGTDGARLSLPNLDTNRRCWSVFFGTGFSIHQNLGDEPMELECIFWKRIPLDQSLGTPMDLELDQSLGTPMDLERILGTGFPRQQKLVFSIDKSCASHRKIKFHRRARVSINEIPIIENENALNF